MSARYNSAYRRNNAAVFGHIESDTPENSGVNEQQEVRSESDHQEVRSDSTKKHPTRGLRTKYNDILVGLLSSTKVPPQK